VATGRQMIIHRKLHDIRLSSVAEEIVWTSRLRRKHQILDGEKLY